MYILARSGSICTISPPPPFSTTHTHKNAYRYLASDEALHMEADIPDCISQSCEGYLLSGFGGGFGVFLGSQNCSQHFIHLEHLLICHAFLF